MRTSAVLSHLRKALDSIKEYATADTAYFDSTLDKFKEMSDLCAEMQSVLSTITHTDRKKAVDAAEAIEQLTKQFNEKMADMQSQIDKLSEKIDSSANTQGIVVAAPTTESEDSDKTSIASVVVPSADPEISTQIDISHVRKENSANAKKAAKAYDKALRKIATANHTYYEAAELSQLLYDWHKKRFTDNYKYNCKFKYSYKRIKKLIYLITIAYGYHIEQKDIEQFKDMFRAFLDKIGTDPQTTDSYAVPFEINQLEKEYDSAYDNLTAVALYSQIFDLGLCDIYFRGGIPQEYRSECDGVGNYFTVFSDEQVCDVDNCPENYLSNTPTIEPLPDEDWE